MGLVLLLVVFFAPLSAPAVVALLIGGLGLFVVGAVLWLSEDRQPWYRS
ncbi:MAG TPA: hypothetical protein VJ400_08795 [Thermoplasmata archaeon]|nr:hypothetical protein [Thermoplasmata archaeon]